MFILSAAVFILVVAMASRIPGRNAAALARKAAAQQMFDEVVAQLGTIVRGN